jgi:hypothetical protein
MKSNTSDGIYDNISGATSNTYTIITADSQKYIEVAVSGSGNYIGSATSSFVGPVETSFEINNYNITASSGEHGSVLPNGVISVNYGSSQSFSISPDTGYHILDILVDGSSVGAVSSYNFTNITSSHTIVASFEKDSVPVVSTGGGGGGNYIALINLINNKLNTTSVPAPEIFTKNLYYGISGNEVLLLQNKLQQMGFFSSASKPNGFFGPATLKAVQSFQLKYKIAKKGMAGFGVFGPATKAFLNSLSK